MPHRIAVLALNGPGTCWSRRSIDQVARDAGFGTPTSLRQHLQAALGVSPTVYRRTFRAGST